MQCRICGNKLSFIQESYYCHTCAMGYSDMEIHDAYEIIYANKRRSQKPKMKKPKCEPRGLVKF